MTTLATTLVYSRGQPHPGWVEATRTGTDSWLVQEESTWHGFRTNRFETMTTDELEELVRDGGYQLEFVRDPV